MADKTPTSNELTKYERHYSEGAFWKKLSRIAGKAGVKVVYYALVLLYALTDPATPKKYKAVIAGALGYLILPADILPDFLPFAGLADDWAALIAAVAYVASSISAEVKTKARAKLSEWFPSATSEDFGDLA